MKGIVFNLLEGFIVDGWGEATYEQILGRCPLHTKEPFVGPGTYPDADLFQIAGQAATTLGVSLPDALRGFGRYAFPRLAARFPIFLETYKDPKAFLMSVDSVIHVEVRKLFKDAETPRFSFQDTGFGEVRLEYRSKRRLCPLMEGLLEGLAEHFGTKVTHAHLRCQLEGHDACELAVRFAPVEAKAA